MRTLAVAVGGTLLALPAICHPATIGAMTPAQPLSQARIAALPAASQGPWLGYLARSGALMEADKAALRAEAGDSAALPARPQATTADNGMPLRREASWYGTPDALRVADTILSFQTPAGGWGKNADRSGAPRRPGESWSPPENPQRNSAWSYVGTIDNGATTMEMRFLARVQARLASGQGDPYRAGFVKGLRYLLTAQYPNGGFPQIYPLQGGYHDAVTLNDDAMVRVVELLLDAASVKGDFAFVPAALAQEAQAAAQRAIALFLATQQTANGKRTGWGQQYEALGLELAGARNFEPAALASAESAGVLLLLMRLTDPSPAVQEAVHAGVAWLRSSALRDLAWTSDPPDTARHLAPMQGAGEIWSRYYDARTMRPVFGDRDRSIHDDVNEIDPERRNGYAWFGTVPAKAIERYMLWLRSVSPTTPERKAP